MNRYGASLIFISNVFVVSTALAGPECDPNIGIYLSGTEGAPWTLQVDLKPEDVPLNAPFDATVTVCSQSEELPTRITVDAMMPAHKHGMNYKPKVEQMNANRYAVSNLLFHMSGTWRLEVTAYKDDEPYRFESDINLQ